MRRLIAVIALATLALPAGASECVNGDIYTEDGSPMWAPANHVEGIWTSINGRYLWVNLGDIDEDYTVSVDISDPAVTGATVCPDGDVTLHREEPETEPESVDVVEEFPEVDWSFLIPFGVYLR